jgi:predicted NACHT family NTPase
VTQGVGFVFKPILEDLAKDAAKDCIKDFFKTSLGNVIKDLINKEPLQKAIGKAITEFLELVQQELEYADVDENQLKRYISPFERFLKNESVRQTLGSAFDSKTIDTKILADVAKEIIPTLPPNFGWSRVAKIYERKVKAIRMNSEELRKILDSENLDKLVNQNDEIRPELNLEKYQEGILEQYGNLKLESLDTSGYGYNELKLWRMFIPQNVRESQEFRPQLYEVPKEYLQQLKETGQLEVEFSLEQFETVQRRYLEKPVRSVLELIDNSDFKYLVILGDPGSGKSTLLQYIALEWAELPLRDLPLKPIPLLIELRTYVRNHETNKCKNFLDFLEKGSGLTYHFPQQELHEKLQNGDAIVMFDGLDEVFEPAKRKEIISDIHRFTNDYKDVRVIVTSRVIGYQPQQLRDAEFYHFMLQDLESEQVEDFIERWHNLTYQNEGERERKSERLRRAIKDSSAINQLSGNPLLLTMMAILNRHQELPRDRAELYNQASRILLQQWDMERTLVDANLDWKTIDYKDKQEILRRVAGFMQQNKAGLAGNLIDENNLENIIKNYLKSIDINNVKVVARVLMEQLRVRNFILCFVGGRYYAFVHRTFLEFFCAWSFVWQFNETHRLGIDELINDVFGSHWRDEKWHEVLRLISGMIDAKFVGDIISYLMEQDGEKEKFQNLFLAGKCLLEVRSRLGIDDLESQLLNRLKHLTGYDFVCFDISSHEDFVSQIQICIQAVEIVATSWRDNPLTYDWLKQRVEYDKNELVRLEAVRQIATGWKQEPGVLELLKQTVESDEGWVVQGQAVQEIASGWKQEPGILDLLKQWVVSHESEYVRREAVQEIASGWKQEPGILDLLKQWVVSHESCLVRFVVVQEIASGWKQEPGILELLKQRVVSDETEHVRGEAVRQIASVWKQEPEILELLKQRVVSDESEHVRYVAVRQIASGWKQEPGILDLLKQRVVSDESEDVRCEALQQIASGWKQEPGILDLLKQRVVSDESEDVRREAVRQIASGWKQEPEILELLKQTVESDESGEMRREAIRQIATGWKQEPGILELLKQRVVSDESELVRGEALQQIASGWKQEPGNLELLKQRVVSDESEDVRHEALRQIATGWKQESGILELLKQRVVSDESELVRYEALRQIATGWKQEPGILDLLKQLVVSDESEDVRCEALQQIATGWKQEPGIFEILYDNTLNNPFKRQDYFEPNPRQIALEAIVKQYLDHPQTLPLLQDRAENDPDEQLQKWAKKKLQQYTMEPRKSTNYSINI